MKKIKKIIIAGVVITIALILVLATYLYLQDTVEDDDWTWELSATENNGWTAITFTREQINACDSDAPEDVFESILISGNEVLVFQVLPNGELSSWWWSAPANELQHMLPNEECNIHVTMDCTLTISR